MHYDRLMTYASNSIDLLKENGLSKEEIMKETGMSSEEYDIIENCELSTVIGDVYDYDSIAYMLKEYNESHNTNYEMSKNLFWKVRQCYLDDDSSTDATYEVLEECLRVVIKGE